MGKKKKISLRPAYTWEWEMPFPYWDVFKINACEIIMKVKHWENQDLETNRKRVEDLVSAYHGQPYSSISWAVRIRLVKSNKEEQWKEI